MSRCATFLASDRCAALFNTANDPWRSACFDFNMPHFQITQGIISGNQHSFKIHLLIFRKIFYTETFLSQIVNKIFVRMLRNELIYYMKYGIDAFQTQQRSGRRFSLLHFRSAVRSELLRGQDSLNLSLLRDLWNDYQACLETKDWGPTLYWQPEQDICSITP